MLQINIYQKLIKVDLSIGLATTMIGLFIFYNAEILSGNFAKVYAIIILANSIIGMMIYSYDKSASKSSISVVHVFNLFSIVVGIILMINKGISVLLLLVLLSTWAILHSGTRLLHMWKMRELPAKIHFIVVTIQSASVFLGISILFNLRVPNFIPVNYICALLIMAGVQNVIPITYLLQTKSENMISE